jgi:ubiquinone/menaquinone biosynthesis C-methylase UbiE
VDEYTAKTKQWLDERFKRSDEEGIYYAYQPIYGFRSGHSAPDNIGQYTRTCHIMQALSRLTFDSLLDVGGAEGYTAYVVKELFGASVWSSDLSEEACQRARDIFNIDSVAADIHSLPFADGEFDVVLCSETLEHTTDPSLCIRELLRVASKAVVITVPHESERNIQENLRKGVPHSHIHKFELGSMAFLERDGFQVLASKTSSALLRKFTWIIEGMPQYNFEGMKLPKIVMLKAYNKLTPVIQRIVGKRTIAAVISLDAIVCRLFPFYHGLLFLVLKDPTCYLDQANVRVVPEQIINLVVPLYRLNDR